MVICSSVYLSLIFLHFLQFPAVSRAIVSVHSSLGVNWRISCNASDNGLAKLPKEAGEAAGPRPLRGILGRSSGNVTGLSHIVPGLHQSAFASSSFPFFFIVQYPIPQAITMAATEKRPEIIELARGLNDVPMCEDYERMISGMM